MKAKESDDIDSLPVLNMSSLTAFSFLLSHSQNSTALTHLRNNDPSISHLDWDNGKKWHSIIGIEGGASLRSISFTACTHFVKADRLLVDLARYGREALLANLSNDEIQVFRNAGLLDLFPDSECINWWDGFKLQSRANLNADLLAQGRYAEQLTIQEEKEYLKKVGSDLQPSWVSLDSDQYGYDILSYRFDDKGNSHAVLIEVKSFAKKNQAHFYLTGNEWKKATEVKTNYLFYIWCMETKEFKILTVEDVKTHIPTDQGSGKWQSTLVKLTF